MDCIFCQIVQKKAPADTEYEDEEIIVFKDINPKAPIHLLIVPKKHITRLTQVKDEDKTLLGKMMIIAQKIAKDKGLEEGFKVIINCGPQGGQIIDHLHFHLLGGGKLQYSV